MGVLPPYQAGELLLLHLAVNIANANPSTPTGWIQKRTDTTTSKTGALYTRTATASETAPTVTWTGGASCDITISSIEDTDGSTPTYQADALGVTASASSNTCASVTPSKGGSLFYCAFHAFGGGHGPASSTGPILLTNCGGSACGFTSMWWGEAGTAPPVLPTLTIGANDSWLGYTVVINPTNATNPAVVVSAGAVVGGSGASQVLTPGPQTQNGDIEFAVLGFNSATPGIGAPAGWTCPTSTTVSNVNAVPNASTLTACWHQKAGGDTATWTFTNGVGGTANVGVIDSFGNLNTTTPVDVSTAVTWNRSTKEFIIPIINPTANDELELRASIIPTNQAFAGVQPPPTGIIALAQSNQNISPEVVYNDLSMSKTTYLASGTFNDTGSSGISLSLQSTTTPTRTTANQRVDGLFLLTLAPFGAPEPPAGCGNCGLGVGAP